MQFPFAEDLHCICAVLSPAVSGDWQAAGYVTQPVLGEEGPLSLLGWFTDKHFLLGWFLFPCPVTEIWCEGLSGKLNQGSPETDQQEAQMRPGLWRGRGSKWWWGDKGDHMSRGESQNSDPGILDKHSHGSVGYPPSDSAQGVVIRHRLSGLF